GATPASSYPHPGPRSYSYSGPHSHSYGASGGSGCAA
ncbi:unnamed protein product, partial [marine sediment metagenome]